MISPDQLTYFTRRNRLDISGAALDSEEVDGEEVDVMRFRVKAPNRPGKGVRPGMAFTYTLPIDHPMAQFLLELIREETDET